jgi:hypothetical protein
MRLFQRKKLLGLVASTVLIAYGALPTLGALHQALHHVQAALRIDEKPLILAAGSEHCEESRESCEVCQSAARTKHTCGDGDLATAYVAAVDGAGTPLPSEPFSHMADALPAARAPPVS